MAVFALVHGAWHDGSCWDGVVAELERRGHRCLAPDLPGDDVAATVQDYADVVARALSGADGEVVVVGHSVAGRTIPLVPQRTHVDLLVYLAAVVEGPRLSGEPEQYRSGIFEGIERDALGRSFWPTVDAARAMYRRLPEDVARSAFGRLRPQAPTSWEAADPAPVPAQLVLYRDDEFFPPTWMRWCARERLRTEPVELEGGHFPMLEQPVALAELCCRLLEDAP